MAGFKADLDGNGVAWADLDWMSFTMQGQGCLFTVLPTPQTYAPNECPSCSNEQRQNHFGGPINSFSGNYGYQATDFNIATRGQSLRLERSYNSQTADGSSDIYTRPLGYGWTHNYDIKLIVRGNRAIFKAPHGSRMGFTQNGGIYQADPGVWATLVTSGGVYTLTAANQEQFIFNSLGNLTAQIDPHGNQISFTYDAANRLDLVTGPAGVRYLDFGYDGQNRLASVVDNTGRSVSYGYDANDNLVTVNDTRSFTWTYTYTSTALSGGSHLLETVKDPNSRVVEQTVYQDFDGQVRAVRQKNGLGQTMAQISYTSPTERQVTENGRTIIDRYNAQNFLVEQEDPLGRITTYAPDAAFNRANTNDLRGNDTAYQRDAFGLTHNGTNALDQSTGFGYSPDGRNNLISITDDDGTQTTFDYLDPANPNRVTAVNTASGTIHYTYNAWGQITSVTDRRDKTWYYRYDTAGNLHEIEDPLTHITTLQYDNLGRLTTITDANGVVTRYQYDASDNLYRLTRNYDPACNDTNKCNLITDYNFDQSGLLWRIVTPDGRQTRYIRNNARQLVRITRNWQDAVFSDSEPDKDINTRYGYDSSGRLFQIFERLNQTKERQTRIEYDALSRVQQVIFNYVSGSGAPDANLITSYAYTDDGRQSLVDVTDPTGLVTRYRYDELNRLIKVMTNYSPGCNTDDCNLTTQYVYDNVGNLEQLIDPNNIVTQYGYDPLYRLTSVIEAYNHGGPVSDVATAFQYDAEGNLEQLTINNEQLENYTYDALNRLDTTTDALGHSWNYTYDPAGNLSQIQNPKSQIINLVYDDLNRLETTDYPNSDPDVTFAYDAMGNRTQMIDGSDATAYGYDGLNRPLTLQNSQFTIHYLYDGLGNRTRLTYPDGKFISYDYDEADRLDTLTVSWDGLYDYGYANHRLDTLTRPGGLETHYGYDEAGRLDSLTHQLGTQTLAAFSYVLDKAGNIAQASELLSLPPTYYLPVIFKNSSQTLTSITVPEKSAPVTSPTAVAPVDGSIFRSPLAAPLPTATPTPEPSPTPTAEPVTLDRLRAELDSAAANGALSARLHQELRKKLDKAAQALDKGNVDDAIAELNVFSFSLLSKRGLGAAPETADLLMNLARQLIEQWQAQAISSFRISGLAYPLFTAAGPLPDGSTLARLPWLQSATSRTISYQYDALYRLIDANYSDGKSFHYGYDAAGNRLNMTVNGQTTTNYVYNAVNRLTSVNGQSYSYDDNGNLTGDGLHTYAYDSANRLTSVSGGGASAQFAYNGDGDRVSQTVNGVTTNYALDPAGLAQLLMATTSGQSRFYVPGLAQYDNSWQYFVPDRLGSVRQLVNPGGQVVLGQSFDPFGNVIEQGRVVPSVFGYAGEQTDPTGLVFLRARYYSPEVGRFLTPDTLVPDPLRSQPWNRYAYVENNSVRYVDPSGHSFEPMCVFGKDPKTGECKTPLPPVLGAAVSQPATNPAQAALEAVVIGYLFLTQFPLHAPDFGQQPGTSLEQGCNEAGGFQLADVLDLLPPVLRQPESEVVPQVGVPGTSLERPEVLGDGVSRISKADSPVWQGLDPYKDSIKKSGKGKKTLYYEWDYTHNDIEVYDRKGNHRGSMDPVTGEIYKPAVPGRKLNF